MRRFFGLISAAGLILAVLSFGGLTSAQAAAAPATMSDETFSAGGNPASTGCLQWGDFSFTLSGQAYGPYCGTFTETGTGTVAPPSPTNAPTVTAFSASFVIYSATGDVVVRGTKTLDLTAPPAFNGAPVGCQDAYETSVSGATTTYQATIYTPTGNYRDEGTSLVYDLVTDPNAMTLIERFDSTLGQPVLMVPTSKDQ